MYMMQWNLSYERQFLNDWSISLAYLGNKTVHLPLSFDLNAPLNSASVCAAQGAAGCTTANVPQRRSLVVGSAPSQLASEIGTLDFADDTGYSNYNAAQVEFRANNLLKQLTVRTSYTFSKTLDNVSEIFSTIGGGNTVFFAQNPANQVKGPGEYSFSGLDFPHQWSMTVVEQLPFFKEQHGLAGHALGGWSISANYLVASGQRYSPIQITALAAATANGDYYDFGYISSFAGLDTAHPFLGNLKAPSTAVGIFAGDACSLFAATLADLATFPVCNGAVSPTALLSLNNINKTGQGLDPSLGLPATIANNSVRFIMNASTAQSIFGTPFGNAPRNPVTNAISNIGNLSIFKNVKLGEHVNFEFHTTFLNVLNHSNYASVDPILEDAGLTGAFTGFGDPTQTPSVTNGAPPTRRILFGGKITF